MACAAEKNVRKHDRKGNYMNSDKHSNSTGNSHGNGLDISPNDRVISYNASEGERPGGIKVRFKIRVATGKRAREIDARQAKVIMEVLQWQRQQQTRE
jgi:hypothetical protein